MQASAGARDQDGADVWLLGVLGMQKTEETEEKGRYPEA